MNLHDIPLGTPELFNVLIEISEGSSNKYEYDEKLNMLILDYVFTDGFAFPFNYGSIPRTRAEDGDPLDAIVLSSYPIIPLTVVQVIPVGILKLKDRGEQDNKLLTVPVMDPLAQTIKSLSDLSLEKQDEIKNFFIEVGKQKNKTMDIEGFYDRDEAIHEIEKYRV
jgi:inorganic pyrophosphatase